MKKDGVKLCVEGGGDSKSLIIACRKGFRLFLVKAGITEHMPGIVACGSRQNAYKSFCDKINKGQRAMLLVDSESKVDDQYQKGDQNKWQPWQHLANREGDHWKKPGNSNDTDCHLMVQCMEAWLITDRNTLQKFFGQGFKSNALPATGNNIEDVAKETLDQTLKNATRQCKTKAPYDKGKHSFDLLARINPDQVMKDSPWAKRFIGAMKKEMDHG